jgi:two-component system, cell cycle sensor histidine kinase and response regulator CckA
MQTDADRRLALLSSALEQANATVRDRMDELSLVRRVGEAVGNHTSAWTLCSELVDAIARTINCKYTLIYTCGDFTGFRFQAVSSLFPRLEKFPQRLSGCPLSRRLEQARPPLFIPELNGCSEWLAGWPFPPNLASWLFVPLLARNDLRGVLCLADDRPKSFDEQTLRTLMMVVPQIASALANIGLCHHLRESELKYRTLVEAMQDVVYMCDANWRILETNPAATLLFGEAVVGRSLAALFASPEAAGEFQEAVNRLNQLQNFEAAVLGARQEHRVALLSCVKEAGRYSGIIKDITERCRFLEQVAHVQKMESIGTLASGVAHDFNNILAIILPHAELIQARLQPASPEHRFTEVILNATRRAALVTRQLLSLARKDPGLRKPVNFNEVIRTTGKLLEETFERRIRLEFDLDPNPPHIKADETQMEQVLVNLAINARDAMPEGGVLAFSTRHVHGAVRVEVADTGTGVDPAILPRIFDPFFTTKDPSKGTGLGLSMVYGIVKETGGNIEVQSEPGKGTRFILTFPAIPEPASHSDAPEAQPDRGCERILIVDDEPELLEMLEMILGDLGYSVLSASNGQEALKALNEDVQLVILDMLMPVMDGITALREMRLRAPGVKVLIASGYTAPEKMALLTHMGVDGFVHKPFKISKLAAMVRGILDGDTQSISVA